MADTNSPCRKPVIETFGSPLTTPPPALFESFPDLARALPWTALVDRPTPIQRLDRLSDRLGAEVWVKRDDLTSPVYGGNKPRKLEFVLAEAREQGRRTLVTLGGLGTNHGLATAIFGRKLGFEVVLLLFEQPVTEHVQQNLLLFQAHGARLVFTGSMAGGVKRYLVTERLRRPGAYFIPGGGSSPAGTLGYVDAAFELAGQIARGEAPLPSAIFVAAGSSGTLAGLTLGCRLAGLSIPIHGVQVAPGVVANPKNALRLARRTLSLMQRADAAVPRPTLAPAPLIRHHYGAGYGHPTDAGREARELLAETEGLDLDLTYTAKAMAALLEYVRQEKPAGPVLFWHTFNSVQLDTDGLSPASLPPEFHRFFDGALRP